MKTLCLNNTRVYASRAIDYTFLKTSIYDIFISEANGFNTVSHMSNRNGISIKIAQWTKPVVQETI